MIIDKTNIHTTMIEFIKEKKIKIHNYDTMVEVYLKMINNDYYFVLDKDITKDILIDLAYKLCPNDDFNKALVMHSLSILEDDSSEEEDEVDEKGKENIK